MCERALAVDRIGIANRVAFTTSCFVIIDVVSLRLHIRRDSQTGNEVNILHLQALISTKLNK